MFMCILIRDIQFQQSFFFCKRWTRDFEQKIRIIAPTTIYVWGPATLKISATSRSLIAV